MGPSREIAILVTLLVVSACWSGRDDEARSTLHYEVASPADDPLRAFAWDGGPEVPLHQAPPALRIDFGALGRTADALLYLPFDEGVIGQVFGGASELGLEAEHEGCEWASGRFGAGLELSGKSSRLVLRPEVDVLPDDGWTLQLHVRPELDWGETRILEIPGKLEITTTSGFHPRIVVHTDPVFEVHFPGPLPSGEWTSIGIALSVEPKHEVRAVLNGAARGWRVADARMGGHDGTLLIGGDVEGGRSFRGALDDLRIRSYAATSAEMLDQAQRECRPGLHSLELRRSAGVERLELWQGVQPRAAVDSEPAMALGELHHVVVRDGRLRWVPGQWTELEPTTRPPARTTHPTVFIGEHRALVFGGETRDTHLGPMVNTDDTWLFHTGAVVWERVATSAAPSPRCHQSAAYSPDHGLVLLIGGFRNDSGKYQVERDAWVYDVARSDWRRIEPQGYPAHPSGNNALVYSSAQRAFFQINARGIATWRPDEDLWTPLPKPRAVDARGAPLADFAWPESPTCGLVPGKEQILLFGGTRDVEQSLEFLDRTYLYDLGTNTLTLLDTPEAPSPRVRPGFALDTKRGYFVLFGGVQDEDSERLGDLWRFLPEARVWQRVESAGTPSRRGGYYGMAYDPELDAFFLLCGRHDLEVFLNEAWKLQLDDRAVGRATYVFAREELPERATWSLRAATSGDARVEARFRSGTAGRWGAWKDAYEELRDEVGEQVMVELSFHPGTAGEVPEVLSLGFVDGD